MCIRDSNKTDQRCTAGAAGNDDGTSSGAAGTRNARRSTDYGISDESQTGSDYSCGDSSAGSGNRGYYDNSLSQIRHYAD